MTDRIHFGRKQKPEAVCANCGEALHRHSALSEGQPGLFNDCPGFRRKGAKTKGSKRSIHKYSKAAERKAADYLRGRRMPNTGRAPQLDVVAYGPDGDELMGAEVKHGTITKRRKDAMTQAVLAARGRGKGLIPCLVEIDKPGRGSGEGVDMVSLRAQDWERLLERLGAG